MDKTCDMVRDLLPLVVDGACSDASRAFAEEHIRTCPACGKIYKQLQNDACENSLRQETSAVLAPRRWRNRAFAVSCALAAFLCVPACLLAVVIPARENGMTMDWGWLLLLAPSLLVEMSATILPLRTRRYTGRWTLLGFTGSLLLLLLACMVYTNAWYFKAAAVALYALSAAALVPWAVKELPLQGAFGKNKGLALAAWDGGFAFLMATAWCMTRSRWSPALLGIGAVGALIALCLAEYGLATRLPLNKTVRAGLCVALAGNGLTWLIRPFLLVTGAEKNVIAASLTVGFWLLVGSTALGLVLVAWGIRQAYKRSRYKR